MKIPYKLYPASNDPGYNGMTKHGCLWLQFLFWWGTPKANGSMPWLILGHSRPTFILTLSAQLDWVWSLEALECCVVWSLDRLRGSITTKPDYVWQSISYPSKLVSC